MMLPSPCLMVDVEMNNLWCLSNTGSSGMAQKLNFLSCQTKEPEVGVCCKDRQRLAYLNNCVRLQPFLWGVEQVVKRLIASHDFAGFYDCLSTIVKTGLGISKHYTTHNMQDTSIQCKMKHTCQNIYKNHTMLSYETLLMRLNSV